MRFWELESEEQCLSCLSLRKSMTVDKYSGCCRHSTTLNIVEHGESSIALNCQGANYSSASANSSNDRPLSPTYLPHTRVPSPPRIMKYSTRPLRPSFKMSTSKSSNQLTFFVPTAKSLCAHTRKPIVSRKSCYPKQNHGQRMRST